MVPIVFQLCVSVVTMRGCHGFHFAAGQKKSCPKPLLGVAVFYLPKLCKGMGHITDFGVCAKGLCWHPRHYMLDGSSSLFPCSKTDEFLRMTDGSPTLHCHR